MPRSFDDEQCTRPASLEDIHRLRLVGAEVTVVSGPETGRKAELGPAGLIVGASAGCDLRLTDDLVSRRHLEILAEPEGVRVTDLGSRNGAALRRLFSWHGGCENSVFMTHIKPPRKTRSVRSFVGAGIALTLAALPWSCGTDTEGGTAPDGDTQASSGQPPIHITFDLHSDPEPQVLTLDERRQYFRRQLANAEWLLDTVEPYGGRISFLAVGEFYEFCVEESERAACLPLLERLAASGGILGTHQHCQYYRGPHDWPDIASCYGGADPDDVRQVWDDGQRFTDEAVRQALDIDDDAAVAAVNTACASHASLTDPNVLMEEHGYTIREGGGDQTMVPLFGHVPWNPFRPGDTATAEDLTTPFVTIPQGQVLGDFKEHLGLMQDGRPPRKKAEILELYANWLERERTGAAPKVWTFGWGLHTQDIDEGSDNRAAVEELIPWLYEELITPSSPKGRPQARFASYVEVRDEYLAWEQEHPGESSFDYPLTTADYSAYPYLEWANRYLHAASFDQEETAPAPGIRAFRLSADGHGLVLVVAGEATGTLDASALGATVRRVDLATGAATEVDAAAVAVGPGSAVVCAPTECDAILQAEIGGGEGGAGGGDPSSCSEGGCPEGKVCCPESLPCAGSCLPDCRLDGAPPCPSQAPTCDPATGLCAPGTAGVSSQALTVTNPTSGVDWWAKAFYPEDASAQNPYPAVVVVPGGSGAGSASENDADPSRNPADLASHGFVVVIFDADGRGNTAGQEDYCGFTHQDGLGALVEEVATLAYVDPTQVGIFTGSYGITMGSGVLARYPALPVRFLVDFEGPADRNDTGHCDASNTGHIDHDCADDAWWSEREAATFIRQIQVPYLRLQNEVDHAQPDNLHCLLMIDNATDTAYGGTGQAPWTRVNLAGMNDPNLTFTESSPPVYNENGVSLDLTELWTEMLELGL